MNRFHKIQTALLLTASACLLFSACAKSGKNVSSANRVVIHNLSDFESLNPFNSTDANSTYAEEQIFDRLIHINPKTLEYNIPWLAEAMPEESADHMTFDFKIRKDIKWADGKPLTGDDVIFSLKALKNPLNTSSAQKRTYVDYIHSAEFIDGDHFRVRFKMAKPYFLVMQAGFGDVFYILPKHIFDPKGLTDQYSWDDIASIVEKPKPVELDSAKIATLHFNPIMQEFATEFTATETGRTKQYLQGSGPYKFDEWVTQQYVRFVKNPNYVNHWGPLGEAHPDTLIYKTISDWNSAVTALKSHDMDVIGQLQAPYYVKIDTGAKTQLQKTSFFLPQYTFLGFNQKNPIFRDPKVRLALAYLVDRKTMIDKILYGLAKPTQSPTFFGRPEFNGDLPEIPFDPNRAKALLDSLGWRDSDGDGILDKVIDGKKTAFKFTFLVNAGNETRKRILLVVAESMRKVGISAEVSATEWSIYLSRMRDHQFDAHFGAWISDPYETDNYQLYHSSQATNRGSNYDSYTSPRADRLMEQIRAEPDIAKRLPMQRELQRIFYEDQTECFLWVPENSAAYTDRFDNVSWNAYRPGYDPAYWSIRGAAGVAQVNQ
jgi:peptide/nickel transport system substrate-binding protein